MSPISYDRIELGIQSGLASTDVLNQITLIASLPISLDSLFSAVTLLTNTTLSRTFTKLFPSIVHVSVTTFSFLSCNKLFTSCNCHFLALCINPFHPYSLLQPYVFVFFLCVSKDLHRIIQLSIRRTCLYIA
jgi:hypothetical protein